MAVDDRGEYLPTEGDRVQKTGGDYSFEGVVVSAFAKRSGAMRYVVEDDRGLLFIFNRQSLRSIEDRGEATE